MISIAVFKRVFITKTNRMLQTTIKNSEDRIGRLQDAGLGGSAAEDTEINRIRAAAEVLDSRGFYDSKKTLGKSSGSGRKPVFDGGSGSMTDLTKQPWFKSAAAIALGFIIFRKLL